jgi:hypothetical protein
MSAPLPIASADDRVTWLDLRRGGVTATDIAGIPDRGLTDAAVTRILADKRSDVPGFRSAAMDHGSKREPAIAAWVERESSAGAFGGGLLIPSRSLYAHPDYTWRLATPDGLAADWDKHRELLEVKTTVKVWRSIPRNYLRQVFWQQHVLGAHRTLVVWERHEDGIPVDLEPSWCWVDRDDDEVAHVIDLGQALKDRMDRQSADLNSSPFDTPDTDQEHAA